MKKCTVNLAFQLFAASQRNSTPEGHFDLIQAMQSYMLDIYIAPLHNITPMHIYTFLSLCVCAERVFVWVYACGYVCVCVCVFGGVTEVVTHSGTSAPSGWLSLSRLSAELPEQTSRMTSQTRRCSPGSVHIRPGILFLSPPAGSSKNEAGISQGGHIQ